MIVEQLTKESLAKIASFVARKRFGKVTKRNARLQKELLERGYGQAIRKEKTLCVRDKNTILCAGTLVVYADGLSEVKNFFFEPTMKTAHMQDFVARVLDLARVNGSQRTRVVVPSSSERFFSSLRFKKVGELHENGVQSVMDFVPLKEEQVDLSKKIAESSLMEDVSLKASEQLRKLSVR